MDPLYLDKSSITATSSYQKQHLGSQPPKQQKLVSHEKTISTASNLNTIQQIKPKSDNDYTSVGAKHHEHVRYRQKLHNVHILTNNP